MTKRKLLENLAAEIRVCKKCPLWKTRKNAVPGEGNPDAQIMLIGEAPGYWENEGGKPFVGAAGKFLKELLAELGFSREDVFIANVLKCRPPKNREPSQNEIETCTPYLDAQIKIIKPKIIVTLGNYSTAYVFSKAELLFEGITRVHGKFYDGFIFSMQITIFPTFHPASALYNPKYKQQLKEDFKLLKKEIEKKIFIR